MGMLHLSLRVMSEELKMMDLKSSVGDILTNASSLPLHFKISDPFNLEMTCDHFSMIL